MHEVCKSIYCRNASKQAALSIVPVVPVSAMTVSVLGHEALHHCAPRIIASDETVASRLTFSTNSTSCTTITTTTVDVTECMGDWVCCR